MLKDKLSLPVEYTSIAGVHVATISGTKRHRGFADDGKTLVFFHDSEDSELPDIIARVLNYVTRMHSVGTINEVICASTDGVKSTEALDRFLSAAKPDCIVNASRDMCARTTLPHKFRLANKLQFLHRRWPNKWTESHKIPTVQTIPDTDIVYRTVDGKIPKEASFKLGEWVEAFCVALRGNLYTVRMEDYRYSLITTMPMWESFLRKLKKASVVAIDTETRNLNKFDNKLATIQFSFSGNRSYVLPVYHPESPWNEAEINDILDSLRDYLETGKSLHLYANAVFDLTQLRRDVGVRWYNHKTWDIMRARYCLNENLKYRDSVRLYKAGNRDRLSGYSLAQIAIEYGTDIYFTTSMGKAERTNIFAQPLATVAEYGGVDTAILMQIYDFQRQEIAARGMAYSRTEKIITNQCHAMAMAFVEMENTGLPIDRLYLAKEAATGGAFNTAREEIRKELYALPSVIKANRIVVNSLHGADLFGRSSKDRWVFNIDSVEHLQLLFFKVLKLEPTGFGKDGLPSVNKKFKSTYAPKGDDGNYLDTAVREVQLYADYSEAKQLYNTFLKGFYKKLQSDPDMRLTGRLLTRFKDLQVVTGRVSQVPTLQNVPSRSRLAKPIKRQFAAPPKQAFLKMDFCLDGDTLLFTDRGIRKLDSLCESSDSQDIDMQVSAVTGAAKAVRWLNQGRKVALTVLTDSGLHLSCTPDHKIMVMRGKDRFEWVEAGNLCKGDVLCHNRAVPPASMAPASVPYSKKFMLPDIMTPAIAYVLAFLQATGIETAKQRIGSKNKALRYAANFEAAFGSKPLFDIATRAWVVSPPRSASIRAIDWIRAVSASTDNSFSMVPECVLHSDRACHMAYLAGLIDRSGSVENLTWYLRQPRLQAQVASILRYYGHVTKLADGKLYASDSAWTDLSPYMPGEKAPTALAIVPDVHEGRNYHLTTVTEIAKGRHRDVYDITMSPDAEPGFAANGIVVHNCSHEVKNLCIAANDNNLKEAYKVSLIARREYRLLESVDDPKRWDDRFKVADLHRQNCKRFFNVEPINVTKEQRTAVKTLVFGTLYGMSAMRLAATLNITEEAAQELIDTLFRAFPDMSNYIEVTYADGRAKVYVVSSIGRVRHLWGYLHTNKAVHGAMDRRGPNCVDDTTECLTPEGWRGVDSLKKGDLIYTKNPTTGNLELQPIKQLTISEYDGKMWRLDGAIDALVTPNHRWLANMGKSNTNPKLVTSEFLAASGSNNPVHLVADRPIRHTKGCWLDSEVTLMGWVLTDGHYDTYGGRNGAFISQSERGNPDKCDAIRAALKDSRLPYREQKPDDLGKVRWRIPVSIAKKFRSAMPHKILTPEVLRQLSTEQLKLLLASMLQGNGTFDKKREMFTRFTAGAKEKADMFAMLCTLLGIPCRIVEKPSSKSKWQYESMPNVPTPSGSFWVVELKARRRCQTKFFSKWVNYKGRVWCPTVDNGTFVARRKGSIYVTGNSRIQGCSSDEGFDGNYSVQRLRWKYFTQNGIDLGFSLCNSVHDSSETLCKIETIPVAAYLMESAFTTEVHRRYNRIYGMQFPIGLEVEMEVGGSLATMKGWNYRPEHLRELVSNTIDWQASEMGYRLDKPRIMSAFDHNNDLMYKLRCSELREAPDDGVSEHIKLTHAIARKVKVLA